MEEIFITIIRRCRRRLWLGRFAGAMADVLSFGLLALVAFGTLAHAMGWGARGWLGFSVGLGLFLSLYLFAYTVRGLSLKTVAIRLDRELGFADRISSALDFLRDPDRDAFRQAHIEEAACFLRDRADCSMAIPWPRRGRAFALFVVIGLVSLLPHTDRLQVSVLGRKHQAVMAARANRSLVKELADLRRRSEVHGLKDLATALADAERALEEELRILTPEDLRPPPDDDPASEQASRTSEDKAADDASRLLSGSEASRTAGQYQRLSSSATFMPMGKFDSFPDLAYNQTFQRLDKAIVDANMTAEQLQDLAKHVESASSQLASYGQDFEGAVRGTEGMRRGPQGEEFTNEEDHQNFDRAGLGLHLKAFGEFLNRYASHLGEKAMGQARLELSNKKNDGGEMFNISGPPPKDGKVAVKGVSEKPGQDPLMQGSPEQLAQVAAQAAKGGGQASADPSNAQAVSGSGTSLGGKGAGTGGAGQRAAPVAVLPRAEGGEYLPLEGKLGDGESILQIIDARGKSNIAGAAPSGQVAYRDVFVEYAKGAEAELNGERVPLQMRDYIRAYFRSIRPDAKEPAVEEQKGPQ